MENPSVELIPTAEDVPVAEVAPARTKVGKLRPKRQRDEAEIEAQKSLKYETLLYIDRYQGVPAYKLASYIPSQVRCQLDSVMTQFHSPQCVVPSFFLPNSYFCSVIHRVCALHPGLASAQLTVRKERSRSRYAPTKRYESVYKIEVTSLDALAFMFGKTVIAPRPWYESLELSGYNGGERPQDPASGGRMHIVATQLDPFVMEYVVQKQQMSMRFNFVKARWHKGDDGVFSEASETAPFGDIQYVGAAIPQDPHFEAALPSWMDSHMNLIMETDAKRRKGEEGASRTLFAEYLTRERVYQLLHDSMAGKSLDELQSMEASVRAALVVNPANDFLL